MQKQIQIMLVEDSPEYRETITLAVEREDDIKISSQFGTAEEAIGKLEAGSSDDTPDLILLDLNLPGLSGIEAIPHLTKINPKIPIIVLTQSEHEADVVAAISAGASGYLLKDATRRQIFDGVRTTVHGGAIIDPEVAHYLVHALNKGTRSSYTQKPLSDRELEILTLLAEGRVQKEISDHLNISNNTVSTHIRRIYDKLKVQNAPAAVAKAYKDGIFAVK
ncbi:response regulator transcription factor [Coraliomargarita algicola]|uniref:Response regulator transcription factor n=1 Tax=Coraliomargarita algicola TaxID=3092156 RepID=A0ABZ0RR78_9BACT|nr:response regulator transcription factor [Coraliomargarita sp. J2-16]WPJ97295.1 response regulator transcription factor [Coraliomargarita sp. J2-16]